MNYSDNSILYPDNRALERAIVNSLGLLSEEVAALSAPDGSVTVADNFVHTRGNFEQQRFSSNILEPLRETLEALLTAEYRQQEPLAWAEMQNRLGNILGALGQQQRDAALYEKAIECFNSALTELSQEDSPFDWAATQANLGTALQALGRQQSDLKALNKSIDAYTAALLQWSRKETPEEWALTMQQLGATFHAYGKLLEGNRTFQKAVVSYKNALAEFDADNHALELVATHNNRGAVLHNLAESEENPQRMEEAIRSYETALTVCMEQQLPIHHAVLCRVNKFSAQSVMAELNKDTALADEVADEFEIILECFPHALQPLCAKYCEEQMKKMREMAESSAA
ncbi:MAG: tetratricopeptide repeat protein [Gammaproteobacteria bacterium]|nr:tetratricopeptide repeat protein [Gammaproteobacteria bacterium]